MKDIAQVERRFLSERYGMEAVRKMRHVPPSIYIQNDFGLEIKTMQLETMPSEEDGMPEASTGFSCQTPSAFFGDLPILHLRVQAKLPTGKSLPYYMGSTWRGRLGWEQRALVCPFEERYACEHCIIREKCPYFMLFERESSLPGRMDAPRGYVLYPPQSENENLTLYVTLFGNCRQFLPGVCQSLFNGRRNGLGVERIPYEIVSFDELVPDGGIHPVGFDIDTYVGTIGPFPLRQWLHQEKDDNGDLLFHLLTPLRLRKAGRYEDKLDLAFFFSVLARRLEGLNCLFNNCKPIGKDGWTMLREQFERRLDTHANLTWREYSRYSSRQKRKVPMGGLIGSVRILHPPEWVDEWMRAACLVHVGKGAPFGLGKIVIGPSP